MNRLRDWMGDSAKVTIVTALDETACKYPSSELIVTNS